MWERITTFAERKETGALMNLTWQALHSWLSAPAASLHRRRHRNPGVVAAEINVLESRSLLSANIAGTWFMNGQATNIQQSGEQLVFTNENGQQSSGHFINQSQVVADQWGGLVGTLNADRINWSNNTVWTRTQQSLPNISGQWFFGSQATSIAQNGTSLTFTNENGTVAAGRFLSSTEVIADGWGGLRGTLVNNSTIQWANGTTWSRTQGTPTTPFLPPDWVALNGRMAHISYGSNGSLIFTNSAGVQTTGFFLNSSQVYANGWNITGTLNSVSNPTRIDWSNGSMWQSTNSPA